jgi:hypothetical protein
MKLSLLLCCVVGLVSIVSEVELSYESSVTKPMIQRHIPEDFSIQNIHERKNVQILRNCKTDYVNGMQFLTKYFSVISTVCLNCRYCQLFDKYVEFIAGRAV